MDALTPQIDSFLQYLGDEKHYSSHTVAAYRSDLFSLQDFLKSENISRWGSLTARQVRKLITARHAAGLQSRSLQRQLSSIRSFYKFLQIHGVVTINPADDIPTPKAPQRLPKTIEHEQVERLLSIPGDEPLTIRDRAVMELFYSSGLRLAEIAALDCGSLDLSSAQVRIEKGKGSKSRVVPVGAPARKALKEWLNIRPTLIKLETDALFISKRGSRLSHRSIQQRLKHWAVRQGLDQNIHPHRLRHAFASHLLESSGDIRAVQELLGHANISTTQVYTHLDFQHLAEVYDKAHPRARKTS